LTVTEHAVRARTTDRVSVSQATDFVLGDGRVVERTRLAERDVSPYCFDFAAGELLCVSTPDIAAATFFYQAQRAQARSVIRAPFAALPGTRSSPALVFSIGRCGSTLLHQAFRAAGADAVSEPDYFTQAVLYGRHDAALAAVIGRATQLLPHSIVKLRAECSNAPLLIAGGFPAPRLVFILRDAVGWAESVRRVSDRPTPAGIAALLRALVAGIEGLAQRYELRICYYEDFRQLTARYVNDLLAWIGSEARIRPAAAAELAATDAQEGTAMSRASLAGVADDPGFREAFRAEWSRVRPRALIERLALRGL
jgi:hypothetical protein